MKCRIRRYVSVGTVTSPGSLRSVTHVCALGGAIVATRLYLDVGRSRHKTLYAQAATLRVLHDAMSLDLRRCRTGPSTARHRGKKNLSMCMTMLRESVSDGRSHRSRPPKELQEGLGLLFRYRRCSLTIWQCLCGTGGNSTKSSKNVLVPGIFRIKLAY